MISGDGAHFFFFFLLLLFLLLFSPFSLSLFSYTYKNFDAVKPTMAGNDKQGEGGAMETQTEKGGRNGGATSFEWREKGGGGERGLFPCAYSLYFFLL